MNASGLILILFILLKSGNHVIGENHELGDEDIKNDRIEVTPEVYSEPIEDRGETTTDTLPAGETTRTAHKRNVHNKKKQQNPFLGQSKPEDGHPTTSTQEATTLEYSSEFAAYTQIQETSESATDSQTVSTSDLSQTKEITIVSEDDIGLTNKQANVEVELLKLIVSILQTLIKSVETRSFIKIYKSPQPQGPWIIETQSSKRLKRSTPNFQKTVSTSNCSSKNLQCPHTGLFRLDQSCTKYYECRFSSKCQNLQPKIRTCPKCLKFNADKKICDLPENVPECSNLSQKKECTGSGLFPVPHDCHRYYECHKLNNTIELMVKTCPTSAVFNQKERQCVAWKKCRQHGPKCGVGKSYLPDKFNCSVYYRCDGENQAVPLACPVGFVFDGHACEKWEESKLNWLRNKRISEKKVHNSH